jgi:hypothetical protein
MMESPLLLWEKGWIFRNICLHLFTTYEQEKADLIIAMFKNDHSKTTKIINY